GNEPSDVLNYRAQHGDFPHQTTMNQFFTESQFESYRALGHHVAHEVFGDCLHDLEDTTQMSDTAHRAIAHRLFANLNRRWFPPPPKLEENYLESVKGCIELEVALRTDPNLAHFSETVFPELQPASADAAVRERAEVHAVSQMLQ